LPRAPQWLRTSSLAKCLNSVHGRPASTLSTIRAGALMVRGATCESYQSHLQPRYGEKRNVFLIPNSYSFHDYLRIAALGSPSTSAPSLASSTSSSLRSSPVLSSLYQAPFVSHVSALPRLPPPSREFSVIGWCCVSIFKTCLLATEHEFIPRTIGGTTYFPIRLGNAHLGYVTPSGVKVFTDY
jgi:hypothetical protein